MADGFPENASNIRESDRQNLMKHILDAVKQCQVRFGGKTELATEKDSCVQCLLAQFENAFLHGLRKGKVWEAINSLSEPLRQVTGKVLSGLPDTEQTFWPFIKEFMVSSEIHRLMSLNNINTDSGRCRAWLRSCLNENSLERILVAVLSDKNHLRQHYEDWALFNDEERSSTLPVMARGLGFIVFAIGIDSSQLNTPMRQPTFPRTNAALAPVESRSRNDPLPVIANKGESQGDLITGSRKKRKKKIKQATISDIEEPEDEPVGNRTDQNKPNLKSSSRSTEDVKSAVNQRTIGHSEMIKKFTQSHRRATSLESSDLNQQKKHMLAVGDSASASFEVPDFNNRRTNLIEVKRGDDRKAVSDNNKPDSKKPDDSQPISDKTSVANGQDANTKNVNKSDNAMSSEYSNLMSKLANLSTSFKTSFSSGIMHRIGSRDTDDANEKEVSSELTKSRSVEDLMDDENDVFTSSSKLEIADNSNGDVDVAGVSTSDSTNDNKNNEDTIARKFGKNIVSTAEVAIPYINSQPYRKISYERDSKIRSRNPSDCFDKIIGQGDYLSPNEYSIVNMDGVLNLKTPPCTPATTASQIPPVNGSSLVSSGLEQRLQELRRVGDDNEDVKETESDDFKLNLELKLTDSKQTNDDNAETGSVNSSYTESLSEDLDIMQPVGFESDKFNALVMTYDHQSSQAASDALQLLRTSSEMHQDYDKENDDDHVPFLSKQYRTQILESSTMPSSSAYENDLSTTDLKQAILATAKKKDEVEERNRVLQLAIDEEREYSLTIKSELDNLEEKSQESNESNLKKIEALSRENEVLRNQLKKYVAAVQLLKRENKNISQETNEAIGTLRGYSEESDVVLPPQPKDRSPSELDSIYEEKLVQMSELHGELIEFHESLQRDLLRKQNQISKMKEELIVLRGPLPDDLEELIGDDKNTSRRRPLINVWIPSVFIKGKGSDAHHLYQVYIRIGDEEWNIYRRYSQFHKMHMMCCKEHSEVERFNFPPKKILGKKDVKFVEGRRRKLQEYVRRLINFWITKSLELAESPNRENLENALTFFSDEFNGNGKRKKESTKKRTRNSPVYTGL